MFIRHIPTSLVLPNNFSVDFESTSSQYASIANGAQTGLAITGDLTLEGDVKLESAPTSNNFAGFVSRWSDVGANDGYNFLYWNNAGTFRLYFAGSNDGSTNASVAVAQTLTVGTWYHVAVVFTQGSPNSTVDFYVNGSQVGTTQTLTGIDGLFAADSAFAIGANKEGTTQYLDGLMNNWRVWNVARTQTQINDNKDRIITSGPVSSWYSVNNNHNDLTATGNNLTATNSPTFSTDVPF